MERWIAGRLRGGLACALLFTLAALPVRGQDPVAMVENPAGSAMVKPATGEPAKALHHGDTLVGKDRIQLASGGRVTLISVASLEKKDLSGGVDSAVDALLGGGAPVAAAAPSAPKLSSLVAVLSAPQLEPEGIKRVQMPRTVRGRRRGFVDLIYPRNTRIREDRPTFRWKPVTGADGYEITILTGTMEPVVDRESVKTNEFTYPPGIPPLAPGRPYFWQIRARGAGRRP
ncbi:MAG: hypothetical protein HY303_01665, partial [Candidatus Wallbacteria bacterium]|nr:hypothetical protein [Candidatus Wallbacteria bacterium]